MALILEKDSTGKLKGKWIGPVKIKQQVRDHSYVVETLNGRERLVHANKLRRYYARTNTVGMVFDADDAFGSLEYSTFMSAGDWPHEALDSEAMWKPRELAHLVQWCFFKTT